MLSYFRLLLILFLAIVSFALVIQGSFWVAPGFVILAVVLLMVGHQHHQENRIRTLIREAYTQGEACMEQEEYAQAIEQFSLVIEKGRAQVWIFGTFSYLAETYALRGQAYQALDNDISAEEDQARVKCLTPNIANKYMQRGYKCLKKDNYQQAVEHYNQAIKLDPEAVDAYFARGIALLKLEHYADAITDCTSVIQANPECFAGVYMLRGCLLTYQGHEQAALEDFRSAAFLAPSALAYWNLSIAQQAMGQHENRIASLEKALELDDKFTSAYYSRGNLRQYLGDSEGAMRDFGWAVYLERTRVQLLIDEDAHGLYERGFARYHMGYKPGAIADLKAAEQLCQKLQYHTFLEKVTQAIAEVSAE